MESMEVDGQSVGKVYEAAVKAVEHARWAAARCSSSPRRTASPATTSATRRSTGRRRICSAFARPRIRSTSSAPSSTSRTTSSRSLDKEVTELVEASVEFAKSGTDPKPEDALKNVYA